MFFFLINEEGESCLPFINVIHHYCWCGAWQLKIPRLMQKKEQKLFCLRACFLPLMTFLSISYSFPLIVNTFYLCLLQIICFVSFCCRQKDNRGEHSAVTSLLLDIVCSELQWLLRRRSFSRRTRLIFCSFCSFKTR